MSKHHQLIQSIAEGDTLAFQRLYALFSDKVYNTALSYVQNEEDAEEITQDVFVKVFRSAAKFKGASSVSTWIYRIAVNTALNRIKKKRRFSVINLAKVVEPPDFEHPGVLLENRENAKILFKIIHSLPESQQTAFILSYIEELPRQQVADIMGVSLKAVESLLQRAKGNLRKRLEKTYPNRRKKK